jgi:hypothetical protein
MAQLTVRGLWVPEDEVRKRNSLNESMPVIATISITRYGGEPAGVERIQ